jgi:phage shock protein PspC (stress-responsive transcriptional regulator)
VNERLYRSRDDRVIAGVAGGVADYFGIDPSIVRIVWAVLTLFSGGLLFLLYVIMWIVVPEEPYDWTPAYGAPPAAAPQPGGPPPVPAAPAPSAPPTESTAGAPAAAGTPAAVGAAAASADSGLEGSALVPPVAGELAAAPPEAVAGGVPDAAAAAQPAEAWVAPTATAAWAATPPPPPADPRATRRAARAARREERRANRDTSGAVIFGLILVLVGAFFLVQMYVPEIDAGRFWPIVLVVVGIVLLVAAIRPRSGTPPSA